MAYGLICEKCKSPDIEINVSECDCCYGAISTKCNKCGATY